MTSVITEIGNKYFWKYFSLNNNIFLGITAERISKTLLKRMCIKLYLCGGKSAMSIPLLSKPPHNRQSLWDGSITRSIGYIGH